VKKSGLNTLLKFGEALKTTGAQQRLSYLLMTTLLIIAAWTLGRLFWQPWVSDSVTAWQPSQQSIQASPTLRLNLSELHNSHLFGRFNEQQAPVVEKPKVQDAPKSRLNVVLVGVVTSSDPNKSLAVVANRGKQSTYGVGEVIDGTRAKLVQVQSDRVIVDNSGRNETVMLEGLKYSKASQVTEPVRSSRQAVSKGDVEKIRRIINEDPKQVFQYVRMSQVKENGEVVGYRLSPGKDNALFNSVGLRNGDIAVQVNGLDLRDSKAMRDIYNDLSQLTELSLTVERNGQQHEIYIEL
jgi:general secretion pathway protein C